MHRSNIRWQEGNKHEFLSFHFIFTCGQVVYSLLNWPHCLTPLSKSASVGWTLTLRHQSLGLFTLILQFNSLFGYSCLPYKIITWQFFPSFVENSSFIFFKFTLWFCYCIVNKAQTFHFLKIIRLVFIPLWFVPDLEIISYCSIFNIHRLILCELAGKFISK